VLVLGNTEIRLCLRVVKIEHSNDKDGQMKSKLRKIVHYIYKHKAINSPAYRIPFAPPKHGSLMMLA